MCRTSCRFVASSLLFFSYVSNTKAGDPVVDASSLLRAWKTTKEVDEPYIGLRSNNKILETCGLVTDICRLKYIDVSSDDPAYSYEYLICDVVYDYGCVDKIIPVENVPAATIQRYRRAAAEDNWFARVKIEWFQSVGNYGCELRIPEGEDVETLSNSQVRRLTNNNINDNKDYEYEYKVPSGMSRKLTTGVKTFVMAVVNQDQISLTEDQMYEYIFGPESLATQLDACSHGLATLIPRESQALVYVETTEDISTYNFNTLFMNVAGPDPDLRSDVNLRDIFELRNNQPLSAIADHIMFLIPDQIEGGQSQATGWAANPGFYLGIKETWLPSTQNNLHELGHNFALEHGFEDGREYQDRTTVMGASFMGTFMCFNGLHFTIMEWYQDRKFTLTPSELGDEPILVELAFYGDYEKTTENQPVYIELLGNNNNYITLNRQKGINREVIEYGDEVIIAQDRDPNPGNELVSHMVMTDTTASYQEAFGDGKDIIVRLCGFTAETDTSPDYVTIALATDYDTACATIETDEPVDPTVTVYVAITYDDKPEEVGWRLLTPGGDVLHESATGSVTTAGQQVITPIELTHGSYVHEITDTGGDGICCNHGIGKVEIYQQVYIGIMNINDDGRLYIGFSGGEYGSGATININTWQWP